MSTKGPKRAQYGELQTYAKERFEARGFAHDVYRKGAGPAVLVITELPNISPQVLGFADLVVEQGLTAVVPDLFGSAGRDPLRGNALANGLHAFSTVARLCVSREFSVFAAGKSSPVVDWLRALAANEHRRCGGPGVGVVGMCFTGGFALAMAVDETVIAPVLSQPSLPFLTKRSNAYGIDTSEEAMAQVAERCAKGLTVLGLRFNGDKIVPAERFQLLRERLGENFVAVELAQSDGHPRGPMPFRHSVLTADLIDEPGAPTRAARDQVLALFRERLLAEPTSA